MKLLAVNPNKVIGRPTIYSVTDVFTRAIVGIYVGLENASWATARKALFNAFRNKVAYCKYFDIDIEEEQWPCQGVPRTILADNGEFNSFQSDDLVMGLALLPKMSARITRQGIKYKNLYYICQTAMLENWFDKIRGCIGGQCQLMIDPDNLDTAYVILKNRSMEIAERTAASRDAFQHWSELDLDYSWDVGKHESLHQNKDVTI